jgi:superfamily II DNA helicase RecQ
MKRCSGCKEYKEESEFNRNASKADGLQPYCRDCRKIASRKWYEQNTEAQKSRSRLGKQKQREELREARDARLRLAECADCGEPDPIVLEFDHINPTNKLDNIGTLISRGVSKKVLEEELDKCEVVCANCHRRRTAKQYNWSRG